LALSVYLFGDSRASSQQDNGLITATRGSGSVIFCRHEAHQEALGQIVQADPAVASVAMAIGGSRAAATGTSSSALSRAARCLHA
jgi:HAE1 family hydrophobic/amphiphilic exporter-1